MTVRRGVAHEVGYASLSVRVTVRGPQPHDPMRVDLVGDIDSRYPEQSCFQARIEAAGISRDDDTEDQASALQDSEWC
jgi:hypothetical protein